MGAYVKLLEYDNIDGMILLSELSRRRIRSVQKLIRVGRNEVAIVLRVDKEKGGMFPSPSVRELAILNWRQGTSIFPSDESLPRMLSAARSGTTRARLCTRS